MNSAEKSGLGKTTQWRLWNRPLFKNKVDLVLKKIISFVCCARKEGDSPPYFQTQLLLVFNHRENGEDKESDQEAGN